MALNKQFIPGMPAKRSTRARAPRRETVVRFGPAGWLYKDWEGVVYPREKSKGVDPLRYIADFFDTVEINSTFYGPPIPRTTTSWVNRVKDHRDFRFTAKLWKRFTHERDKAWTRGEVDQVRKGFDVMIALALLIYLPVGAVAAIGVAMIAVHNAFDGVQVTSWAGPGTPVPGFWASVWHILHVPGLIFPFGQHGPPVLILYPLIPWIGVMAAGYAFGSLYRLEPAARRGILIRLGTSLSLAFIVLRAINIYGDPAHWAPRETLTKSVLSFLAVSKYPPSLLFLLMTIGPALLFLAWADGRSPGAVSRFFITYGRVPLFFYLLQWITAHGLALLASVIAGKPTEYFFSNLAVSPPPPPGTGFGLLTVYALWIFGVLLLYPLCRWYAGVKARRNDWWLSYL